MPYSNELQRCASKVAWVCKPPPDSLQWIRTNGKRVYAEWLLISFPNRISDIIKSAPTSLWRDNVGYACAASKYTIPIGMRYIGSLSIFSYVAAIPYLFFILLLTSVGAYRPLDK